MGELRQGRLERREPARKYLRESEQRALLAVGTLRLCTAAHVRRLCGWGDPSAATRALRHLYNAGYVDRPPVPRNKLEADAPAFGGSPPALYAVTRKGWKYLVEGGFLTAADRDRHAPSVNPGSSLRIAHELMVRDAYCWLAECLRSHPSHELEEWLDGPDCWLPAVKPDARFAYRLPSGARLLACVECDRGTEGTAQWQGKAAQYLRLFAGANEPWRMLAIAADPAGRERIAGAVSSELLRQGVRAAGRFAVAAAGDLSGGLSAPVWRVEGLDGMAPLVAREALETTA